MLSSSSIAGRHVCIVGGGSIGVSFAIVFARAGIKVKLVEPDTTRRQAVKEEISEKLLDLQHHQLIATGIGQIDARIEPVATLEEGVPGAVLVQECIPERIELKNAIFTHISRLLASDCIVASSSSAIPISRSAAGSGIEKRALVGHPGNPPHLIPVIEIVPSETTLESTATRAYDLYKKVGLSPVVIHKEVDGFVFNRLQGAVLREAYALVRDKIATVEDIDIVMRDGLGRRWAFMGPFETVDLNTRGGIASHARKMGPVYEEMGRQRGQYDPWTEDLVAQVVEQRRTLLPLSQWDQRVDWRDRQLMQQLSIAQQDQTSDLRRSARSEKPTIQISHNTSG